ncbi:glycosyltransferase [Nitrincola lacisaponensis]|nr:glycosyltransferase [Nitrincola lacisaponensis]
MTSLAMLYEQHQGKVSDKWHCYLPVYQRVFEPYQTQSVSLLEIGIQNGGSLEIWSQFFPSGKHFVGCDINSRCNVLTYDDQRISFVVGDANSDITEHQICQIVQGFHLIIDDGSHRSSDIVRSFCRYFPYLEAGGTYVIEDIHCSYWQGFEGGLYYPFSSIAFFKRLVDVVNHEHWGNGKTRASLLKGFAQQYGVCFPEDVLAQIHSIEFVNSMCIVRKASVQSNQLGPRVIAGQDEAIVGGHLSLQGQFAAPVHEYHNEWALLESAPDEAYESLRTQLQALHVSVAQHEGQVQALQAEVLALRSSTSWRVTAPLRALGTARWRLKHALTNFCRLVRQSGGSVLAIKKMVRLYKRERWAGIQRVCRNVGSFHQVDASLPDIDRNDYIEWVKRYDTLDDSARESIRRAAANLTSQPRISVVMPVYNPPIKYLKLAIESVQKQLYEHWELCIADDASTDPDVACVLQDYARSDPRIKIVYRPENGHISAASNSALAIATGDYIALLDQDDLLSEQALYYVALEISRYPDAVLIYSDEDKITTQGLRYGHYFKSDFNYELFLSQNMISHLGVYRRDVVNSVGGFREGFEGSQDYDLALRVIEKVTLQQIRHIPQVLYHWRAIPGSTALFIDEKNYTSEASIKAVQEHLDRTGRKGSVMPASGIPNFNRVRYALPEELPLVSIVIPTRDQPGLLKTCLDSVFEKTTYPYYEVIIVDNGSVEPETRELFSRLPTDKVRIIRDDSPFNYSRLNNRAVELAQGELVCLMNNDIEVLTSDWIEEMAAYALQQDIGCVGARLWYPNGTLQHAGVVLGIGGVAGHVHKELPKNLHGYAGRAMLSQSFSAVTGACLMVRKSVWQQVRGLDEDLAVAFNDIDFCLRVQQAGLRNVWTAFAEMIHHESVSRGGNDTPAKQALFAKEVAFMQSRWGASLYNDPFYNKNLTLIYEDFSLAWPEQPEPDAGDYLTHNDSLQLTRENKILWGLDTQGKGLEIGPSHNPIAPKKKGYDVEILDHLSAADLRKKYAGAGVNIENIEDVDYVWTGESYLKLIGKQEAYDWIIASHVIEHVPDFISFLQQCERLLKDNGRLALAVPDKRFCFDFFGSLTTSGNIIDAHLAQRSRPSTGQIFDFYANSASRRSGIAWSQDGQGDADTLTYPIHDALAHWKRAIEADDYTDVHCWRFTPASFQLIIHDLAVAGYIDLEIKHAFDTEGCEFFVTLGRKGALLKASDRLSALKSIVAENTYTNT